MADATNNQWINAIPTVTCPDGTKDIANGFVAPCLGHGGGGININQPKLQSKPVFKPTSEAVNQPVLKNMDVLTAEDKLYEKLGIKYHNTHMFGVDSRLKGRLLLAVVLVAGYFAYKKFKK